jgi:hypothetical protein
MLSADRLTSTIRGRGKDLIIAGTDRVTGAVRGHGKAAIFAGTALALAGAGSASAATIGGAAQPGDIAAHGMLLANPPAHAPLTSPVQGAVHALPAMHGQPATGHGRTMLVANVRHSDEHHAAAAGGGVTWAAVSNKLNQQTDPAAAAHGQVPAADQLTPAPTFGPQNIMQLSTPQVQNATTIVQQALAHRMGLRSAVVAVATAMQESKLLNIDYGTAASLGLFQQQVGMGWGSAQQIMNPVHATDAFLQSLAQYQASNPGWARQPLWQAAQGVQASGAPTAYAQWESQAVHLVKNIAMHIF